MSVRSPNMWDEQENFLRRFCARTVLSPINWSQKERMQKARDLLEHKDGTFDHIVLDCGLRSLEPH